MGWSGAVLRTRTGMRYHANRECEGLAEAAAVFEVDYRDALADGLTPCQVCRPPAGDPVDPRAQAWRVAYQRWVNDNPTMPTGERWLATRVLPQVPGLSPDEVHTQVPVATPDMSYVVDDAIRSGEARLAIEVDGRIKSGSAPTADEIAAASRREHAIAAAGWTVVRFPNARVGDDPDGCAAELGQFLARARDSSSGTPRAETLPELTLPAPPTGRVAPAQSDPMPQPLVAGLPSGESRGRGWLVVAVIAVIVLGVGLVVWLASSRVPASVEPVPIAGGLFGCPTTHPIKGNVNDSGERIYHVPGSRFYDTVGPERCFLDEAAAESDGYRASRAG